MADIRLKVNFGGSPTNFRRIPPGVYAVDDPTLCGLGAWLVENGLAEWAHGTTVIPAESEPEVAEHMISMTVTDAEGKSETTEVPARVPEETEIPVPPDFSEMTVDELESFAEVIGIDRETIEGSGVNGRVLKADLVAAIEAAL